MDITLSVALMALIFAATSVWAAEDKATEEENTILTLLLRQSYDDGGYTVVSPESSPFFLGSLEAHEIKERKEYITEKLKMDEVDVDGRYTVVFPKSIHQQEFGLEPHEIKERKEYITEKLKMDEGVVARLVDRLFERNKKAVRLSIKSSPKDGFLIDYDGKYQKYFEKDGGGWKKWYKKNPKAHGHTTVSLPVYDQKAGLVLVYTETLMHYLAGSGWVVLCRYEKGELRELSNVKIIEC